MDDQDSQLSESKMRQHQIGGGAAKALMLQQQFLLSRGLAAGNGLRSPAEADSSGVLHIHPVDYNDIGDGYSFKPANLENDASVKALFKRYAGSTDQMSNLPQHFHQPLNHAAPAAAVAASGEVQPRQRVRARRGQATDPHSIAERLRRERIAERMKSLQELVPNGNKTDKASMLDEIIDYVKFLQLQVKVLSMSRLGGAAAAVPPLSSEGRSMNAAQTTSSPNIITGATAAEHQVLKLMEEDMGSAMQYLQGKGLCLMPISLATAISTATYHSNPLAPSSTFKTHPAANPFYNAETGGPSSPSTSALTVQSVTMGANNGGEISAKDAPSVSKHD